ncbi:MAG: methyltransferase domain-containing protein [Acidimicrobiia bacterium]|nr:methyltransferase domain-containing protein [Acidimicrobiia bacterium]
MSEGASDDGLRARVAAVPWYHTIELPGGIVTPGEYDLRPTVAKVRFPESLEGKRCLDVGTHDGFWAFEMERRGAASVTAIDVADLSELDWPVAVPPFSPEAREELARRRGAFTVAQEALGSAVERAEISVYDLAPERVGTFDFAFFGTLLHHLRDPAGALAAVRRVVHGQLLVCAVFCVSKTLLYPSTPVVELFEGRQPFWNYPNIAGLRRQVESAGWTVVATGRPFLERFGAGPRWPAQLPGWRNVPRRAMFRVGVPHVWLLAEPFAPGP